MRAMKEQQEQFIMDEFFNCTIRGAFQRARVYTPEAEESAKAKVWEALRSWLGQHESRYCGDVTEEDHIRNIVSLSEALSKDHADTLVNGRFRIGVAQKALNLYLKYLWCLGKVSRPPHCPFDAIVIGTLAGCSDINWTKLDCLEGYQRLVKAAKERAGAASLAEWELEVTAAS
jgi:hypothetical protein